MPTLHSLLTCSIALLGLTLAAAPVAAAPPTYRVTDVGMPEGYLYSSGDALSPRGEVIGHTMGHRTGVQKFAWSASTGWKPWREPFRHPSVLMIDINKQRQIVGSIVHTYVDHSPQVGFVWHADTGTLLMNGLLAETGQSGVMAINDRGVATGWYARTVPGQPRAFIWSSEKGMVDIHPSSYGRSEPLALNNRGQVLAIAYPPGSRERDIVVLSTEGGVTPLGCIPMAGQPQTHCYAWSINDSGQVAAQVTGTVGVDGFGVPTHPVIWTAETGMVDIMVGTPFEKDSASEPDINHRGQMVGRLVRRGADRIETFYWDAENGMHVLDDLVDPADPLKGRFQVMYDRLHINNKGMIMLNARVDGDTAMQRTLVLTPVR